MSDADSSTSAPAAATFPDRPIRFVRNGFPSAVAQLLLAAVLVTLAVGFGVMTWTSVAPDLAIRAQPVTVADGDVSGSCRVKKLVFADCSVTMTYVVGGETHRVDREYFWLDLADHGYTTDIVVAADDPSLATASVALEKLPDRILTAVGFALLFLGVAVSPVRLALRVRRARTVYASEQRLRFRPVDVVSVKPVQWRGTAVRFAEPGGRGGKHLTLLTKREAAVFALPDGRALAAAADGADPVLLDAGLTRLDVTDEERARIATAAGGLVVSPGPR